MTIYLAHPVTGLSYEEVITYYKRMEKLLSDYGYRVLSPMIAKEYLGTEKEMKPTGYGQPVSTDHAITRRDRWMVRTADVVFINFIGTTKISVGCCCELSMAYDHSKHTIVAMEKDNIHRHAFLIEFADILFETEEASIDYLKWLPRGSFHA